MSYEIPPEGSILEKYEFYRIIDGRKVWRSTNKKRYYSWDSQHGEIEVFNSCGLHLGVVDPISGIQTKEAVAGRELNVR